MQFKPPFPPYDPTDKSGFSYQTVVKRWPVILTGVIDELHNVCHSLEMDGQKSPVEDTLPLTKARIAEGQGIISKISKLKSEMGRDHALEQLVDDGEPHVEEYNGELINLAQNQQDTWFTAPWLFAECYLYRLLRSFFSRTTHWKSYDPFLSLKTKTFQQSGTSIHQIAETMHNLDNFHASGGGLAEMKIIFGEMIQMCLWGNATDLSLFTHLTPSDMAQIQSVGRAAQEARKHFILRDDQEELWQYMEGLKGARIDLVLDNAGFELFTDLALADFLVTHTPYVGRVVFHPKLIPWFVSDVTPHDFGEIITQLSDPTFFGDNTGNKPIHLQEMVARWKRYLEEGIFSLSVPSDTPIGGSLGNLAAFWTTFYPYWELKHQSPDLYNSLSESDLVIFKGDLNYRKLTGDVAWPSWTPFDVALGPLAGSFTILSLRTNKADVVVGLSREIVEKMDESGEKWRVDGRYALISFVKSRVNKS